MPRSLGTDQITHTHAHVGACTNTVCTSTLSQAFSPMAQSPHQNLHQKTQPPRLPGSTPPNIPGTQRTEVRLSAAPRHCISPTRRTQTSLRKNIKLQVRVRVRVCRATGRGAQACQQPDRPSPLASLGPVVSRGGKCPKSVKTGGGHTPDPSQPSPPSLPPSLLPPSLWVSQGARQPRAYNEKTPARSSPAQAHPPHPSLLHPGLREPTPARHKRV